MRSKTYNDYEYYTGTWTRYHVLVTGLQVNNRFLNKKEANKLALMWQDKGHKDIEIKKIIMKATKSRKKK